MQPFVRRLQYNVYILCIEFSVPGEHGLRLRVQGGQDLDADALGEVVREARREHSLNTCTREK